MSKASNGHSGSRRQFLAAAPAALVAGSIPATAAPRVTPELADLIAQRKVAREEYLRLKAIDSAATETYYRTAPEIPERITASKITYICHIRGGNGDDDYLTRDFVEEQKEHLLHVHRGKGASADILKSSWWRLQLSRPDISQCTDTWIENIRIADEFETADAAAQTAAGFRSTDDDAYGAAIDLVNDLDRAIEEFDAQSFADIVAIARVSKVIAEEQEIFQESWDDLLRNILSVAERKGV